MFLARAKTLWITFALTMALTLLFGVVMYIGQFTIIDEMYVAEEIRAHIQAMSPRQRLIHAWLTATLDVVYPFVYAAFFIGVALRFFKRFHFWWVLPSLLVVPADLTEGAAQIMLLTGNESYMAVKVVATPIKLVVYICGLCITAVGLVLGLMDNRSKSKLATSSDCSGNAHARH